MAGAPPSPQTSSVEIRNGAKLSRLLFDGGTAALRNVFDRFYPPAILAAGLHANFVTLTRLLHRRVLHRRQWELLFPPGGVTPDSNTFDITLLFILLTNFCGLSPPLSGWYTLPPSSDTSLEANIARLSLYRNDFAHSAFRGFQAAEFDIKWQEISTVLVALGLDQADVDGLKAEGWEHDLADSLWDVNTRLKEIKVAISPDAVSKLEENINIQTKTQETVEKGRLTQPDDPKTLQGSNSELDEVLNIPQEIRAQGPIAEAAFKEAMEKGSVPVYRGRIMLLGQDRAGKTNLKKFLLGISFDPEEESTIGIEPTKFEVEIDHVKEWHCTEQKKLDLSEFREDIAKLTAERMKELSLEDNDQETIDSMDLKQKINDPFMIEEDAEGLAQSDATKGNKAEIDSSFSNVQPNDMPADQDLQLGIDTTAGLTIDDIKKKVEQCLQGLELNHDVKAGNEVILSVWDFAGQRLYYASHSVFLSLRAVYVLVYNLSKDLSAQAKPCAKQGILDIVLENPTNQTNLDNLLSWLVSVHCIRPTGDEASSDLMEEGLTYLRPPVFVVGTHADIPFKDIKDTEKHIKESISRKTYNKHVIRPFFAVDNTRSRSDYGVQALKNRISEVLKQEPYMGEKVPIRWFHFEKVIEALVAKEIYHMELNQLLTITKRYCRIDDEVELKTMLNFYHDLGVIVKHGRTVVLQALWLIDLFKKLITVRPFDEMNPLYSDCWQELEEKGILRMDLVDHVFSDFIQKGICKQDILNMMELYGLIAKFSFLSAEGKHQQEYFVPAQLRSLPLALYEMKPSNFDPCPLFLHFLDGFVPHGLFAQLVSRCIVWCSGCSPEMPELYQNGARFFFIGKQRIFDLILICRKSFIKIILMRNPQASAPSSTESATKAREVRLFFEDTLKDMSRELFWLRNLSYELYVECTHCLKSTEPCSRHKSIRCADDDCLSTRLIPLRPEEQLNCRKNLRERIEIAGLEKWLLANENENEEKKLVSGNPKASAQKRGRESPCTSPQPQGSVPIRGRESPCTSSQTHGPAAKRKKKTPGSAQRRGRESPYTRPQPHGLAVKRKRESPVSSSKLPKLTSVKDGAPEKDVLQGLAVEIVAEWKEVGRRLLNNNEAELCAIDHENKKLSEKAYKMLLKWTAAKGSEEAKQSGSLDSSMLSLPPSGSAAEQLSTEDNDDSDKDIGDHDDDSDIDNGDCTNGDREITKKQVSNTAIEKQELEQPENPKEEEPDKKMIREDRVPCEGDTWSLPEAAALVTFCPGAITKPLLISCSILNPRTLSPPLGSNEVLVSNVIELSHGDPPDLEFSGDRQGSVTVALMHSASNFRGYEVVIKHLVDPENNEWVDLVTSNFWNTSAKSTVPNWLFPFAEAVCTITPYSSFAAIWRLKTFLFLKPRPVTPEFTCTVPDYPDVSVSIPWNSVPAEEDFCLTFKVQELPSTDRNEQGILVGPVLHISSSHNVELLEPAKITIPFTFFKGRGNLENPLSGTWKIFHFSREKSEEWTESTDQLVMPPVLANGIVTFQVKHFCRIWLWWLEIKKSFGCLRQLPSDIYQRAMGQQAGFIACLCDDVTRTNYVLTLSCFPIHLRDQVNRRISETYLVNFQGEGSSEEPLCTKDQAHVTFSEAFSLKQSGKTEDLYVRFLGNAPFQKSWPVSVRDPGNLQVDFFKSQYRQERRRSLCTLYIIPRSPVQASPMEFPRVSVSDEVPLDSPADLVQRNESSVKRRIESPCTSPKRTKVEVAVKDGTPEKDVLERLAVEIVAEWKEVGRRLLNNNEAELDAIDHENKKMSEKAYKMLLKWTAAKGSEATYQVLYNALCDHLVNRRDLAEKYCLVNHD